MKSSFLRLLEHVLEVVVLGLTVLTRVIDPVSPLHKTIEI